MILQCSNCNARYLVPDHSIGAGGRTVRCVRCKHTWFENPPVSITNATDNAVPDLDTILGNINETPTPQIVKPLAAGSNLPVRRDARTPAGLKSLVLMALFLVIGLGLFITFPNSQALQLLGLQPSAGLVLTDIKIDKKADEKANLVEISGSIINIDSSAHQVPTLRITLLDDLGSSLQFWEYKGNNKIIEAKENLPFSTGDLNIKFTTGSRFVVDLGTPLELALRRKP